MEQKRAYKYRFYPTDEQKRTLARTFGCCRYVYNCALRERTDAYYQHGERLYYDGTSERLTALKKQDEHVWLNEVSSVPLQQALRHLDKAFRNFFEGRAEYPTFKKKRQQQAATYASNAFSWDGHHLTLAKMEAPLPTTWHRPLPDGCKPRIWSKTTLWQKPSRMSDGVSSPGSWSIKPSGMDVPSSRLTSGTHLPNAALTVDIFLTPYRLMFVAGGALSVASSMIGISMRQRTFWPRGSRLPPVERL